MNELMDPTWIRWIPVPPLIAAVVHGLATGLLRRPMRNRSVAALSIGAVLSSLVLTGFSFRTLLGMASGSILGDRVSTWIGLGVGSATYVSEFAFRFDALSAVMCLVVTGVGLLIHIYSADYMESDDRDDKGYQRYFCFLNLFIAAMLVLVLSDNLLLMFMGWEGVGVCSYLLIGFWYSDADNPRAGTKAFIVNRVGDFGFLVGMLLLYWTLVDGGAASVSFRGIEAALPVLEKASLSLPQWLGGGELGMASAIGLCFFLGACGKSAQLPLFVWLPDAMAGPTPVSALIHAATMVTAGVYMLARMSFLYAVAPEAQVVIAWTGGLTAFVAATAACVQTDIKKVLAYSTISQLGFMFLAAGCGAYTASIFHLVTHAFFKATLFLGAGVVILSLQHEQSLLRMGGLGSRFFLTRISMWMGVLALVGCPLFSGFFSKDQILLSSFGADAVPGHEQLYWLAVATVGVTAFYGARLIFLTFHGESRLAPNLRRNAKEPAQGGMMWSLGILALLSLFGSLIGVPQLFGDELGVPDSNSIHHFLVGTVTLAPSHEIDSGVEWRLVGATLGISLIGFLLGALLYAVRPAWPGALAERMPWIRRLLERAYYVDAIYERVIVRGLALFSDRLLYRVVDVRLIDGFAVMGSAHWLRSLADGWMKHAQSGLTQVYFMVMVMGSLALLAFLVFWDGS